MDRRNPDDDYTKRGSRGGSILAGLVIGGIIGAGTMLLLAPQSGRETREQLQQGAIDLKDRATDTVRDTADQVRGKAAQLTNQGKEIAAEQLDKVASTAEAGKKTLQRS
jgi:gas vesicle protein